MPQQLPAPPSYGLTHLLMLCVLLLLLLLLPLLLMLLGLSWMPACTGRHRGGRHNDTASGLLEPGWLDACRAALRTANDGLRCKVGCSAMCSLPTGHVTP
jgi:hypothetical protein